MCSHGMRKRAGGRVTGGDRQRRQTDKIWPARRIEEMEHAPQRVDRYQRLRLHRFRLAMIGYGFLFSVMAYLWLDRQLVLDTVGFAVFFLGAAAVNGLFLFLMLSGRNLSLRDPSMTFAQTLTLILIVLFMGWVSRTLVAQDAAVMALEVGMLFGMFRLGVRALAVLAGVGFVGFLVIATLNDSDLGLDAHETIVRVVIVAGVLAWTTVFASYVGQLRWRLSSRNTELRDAFDRLEEVAKRDGLTGIYNRKEVFRQLEEALAEGLRLGTPVSVSLFDLDSFKDINDRFGHSTGDAVLCEFVRRVKSTARSIDRLGRVAEGAGFGRYGGEEFLLVMPMTPLEGARLAAERIREAVAGKPFVMDGQEIHFTVSQGVAEANRRERVEHLLARADRALYKAKREGRNCVCLAEDDDEAGSQRDEASFFNLNGEGHQA